MRVPVWIEGRPQDVGGWHLLRVSLRGELGSRTWSWTKATRMRRMMASFKMMIAEPNIHPLSLHDSELLYPRHALP